MLNKRSKGPLSSPVYNLHFYYPFNFFAKQKELLSNLWNQSEKQTRGPKSSVPVDFLRPKFRVALTKDVVISILVNKYTYKIFT